MSSHESSFRDATERPGHRTSGRESAGRVTGAPRRRMPDRCGSCGRFVGFYPVGFVCDTHCASCTCPNCPLPF